jgi:NAD(P)-dependent dehydrogenase (short-subunit alcohol dehydrogenase family)
MNMNNNEKIAVITGAGRGIGAAAGVRLLKDGFTVYFSDMDLGRAQEFVDSLNDSQGRAFALQMQVTSDESVNTAIDFVGKRHGKIDLLINNAGITDQKPTQDIKTEDWNHLIDIHLGGTFRCSRAAFPYLSAANGAAIVNVSSIAGRFGMPIRASYCAAKAGIEGFTRSLATEWAEFGIRVNSVAPGYVMTELIQKDLINGLVSEEVLSGRISLKRLASPEEIAEVMCFLGTKASSYVTGQLLNVDGGLSIDFNPGNTQALAGKPHN